MDRHPRQLTPYLSQSPILEQGTEPLQERTSTVDHRLIRPINEHQGIEVGT
jgi:hypothetical protein